MHARECTDNEEYEYMIKYFLNIPGLLSRMVFII